MFLAQAIQPWTFLIVELLQHLQVEWQLFCGYLFKLECGLIILHFLLLFYVVKETVAWIKTSRRSFMYVVWKKIPKQIDQNKIFKEGEWLDVKQLKPFVVLQHHTTCCCLLCISTREPHAEHLFAGVPFIKVKRQFMLFKCQNMRINEKRLKSLFLAF